MRKGVLAALVAAIGCSVVMGAPAGAARPAGDPHFHEGRAPRCADLEAFAGDVNATLEAHPTFTEFVFSGDFDTLQATDDADIDELLADGQAMLDALDALDVPPAYADGFAGLDLLFTVNHEFVNFLARDTSATPEVFAFDRAIRFLYYGEIEAAEKCPAEVEALGGYIFVDPAQLESDVRG